MEMTEMTEMPEMTGMIARENFSKIAEEKNTQLNKFANIFSSSNELFQSVDNNFKNDSPVCISKEKKTKNTNTTICLETCENWGKKKGKINNDTFYTDSMKLFSDNLEKEEYKKCPPIEGVGMKLKLNLDMQSKIGVRVKHKQKKKNDIMTENEGETKQINETGKIKKEKEKCSIMNIKTKRKYFHQLEKNQSKAKKESNSFKVRLYIDKQKERELKKREVSFPLFHSTHTHKIKHKLNHTVKVAKKKTFIRNTDKIFQTKNRELINKNEKNIKKEEFMNENYSNINNSLMKKNKCLKGKGALKKNSKKNNKQKTNSFLHKTSVKDCVNCGHSKKNNKMEKQKTRMCLHGSNTCGNKELNILNNIDYTNNENNKEMLLKKNDDEYIEASSFTHSSDFTSENYFSLTDLYDDTSDSSFKSSVEEIKKHNITNHGHAYTATEKVIEDKEKEPEKGNTNLDKHKHIHTYIMNKEMNNQKEDRVFVLSKTSQNSFLHTKMLISDKKKKSDESSSLDMKSKKNNDVCENDYNENDNNKNDNNKNGTFPLNDVKKIKGIVKKKKDLFEVDSHFEGTQDNTTIHSLLHPTNELNKNGGGKNSNMVTSHINNNIDNDKGEKKRFINSLFSARLKKKKDKNKIRKTKNDERNKSDININNVNNVNNVNILDKKEKEKMKKKGKFTKKILHFKNFIFKSTINTCDNYECTDETNIDYFNSESKENEGRKHILKKKVTSLIDRNNEKKKRNKNECECEYLKNRNSFTKINRYSFYPDEMEKQKNQIVSYNTNSIKEKDVYENDKENCTQKDNTKFYFFDFNNDNNRNKNSTDIDNMNLICHQCNNENNTILKKKFHNYDYKQEYSFQEKENISLKQIRLGGEGEEEEEGRWEKNKNKKECKHKKKEEWIKEINLIRERTLSNTKKMLLLKNKMMGKNKTIEDSDFTWDPQNPLNIIGPHAKCHGLRCDYIFFPPINFKEMKKKRKGIGLNEDSKKKKLEDKKWDDNDKNIFINETSDVTDTKSKKKKKKQKIKKKKEEQFSFLNNKKNKKLDDDIPNLSVDSKCQENKMSSDESVNLKNNNLKILKHYYIKSAKILFNEPRVMVDTYKRLNNCCYSLCMKINHVSFVTMSDHYAVKVDLRLKKNVKIDNCEMKKSKHND